MKGRGPTCDSPAVAPVLACDSWLPLSAPALSSSRVSPWVSRVSAYLGTLVFVTHPAACTLPLAGGASSSSSPFSSSF